MTLSLCLVIFLLHYQAKTDENILHGGCLLWETSCQLMINDLPLCTQRIIMMSAAPASSPPISSSIPFPVSFFRWKLCKTCLQCWEGVYPRTCQCRVSMFMPVVWGSIMCSKYILFHEEQDNPNKPFTCNSLHRVQLICVYNMNRHSQDCNITVHNVELWISCTAYGQTT